MDPFQTIRVFVEVAGEGSFRRAAERLDLSRSVITRHIAALETRLKTRLINRDTRKLSLTEAGEFYIERARSIVGQLIETEALVTSFANAPCGRLRVVAPVAFGQRNMGAVLHTYRQRYPDVLPELTLSDDDCDLVAQGYDVGILPASGIRGVTWVTRPLVSTSVVACALPGYIARHGLPREPRELVDHAYVHSGSRTEHVFHGPDGEIRVALRSALIANDIEVLRQAALAGMGIAFLPAAMVQRDLRQGGWPRCSRTIRCRRGTSAWPTQAGRFCRRRSVHLSATSWRIFCHRAAVLIGEVRFPRGRSRSGMDTLLRYAASAPFFASTKTFA